MFAAESIQETLSYIFYQIVDMMTQFTATMSQNGASILSYGPVLDLIWLFQKIAWGLWFIGAFIGVMEFIIAYREEATPFSGTGIQLLKSFIAVNLFSIVPVLLYNFTVDLYSLVGGLLTNGYQPDSPSTMDLIGTFFSGALNTFMTITAPHITVITNVWEFLSGTKNSTASMPFDTLIMVFIMVYVVFKVFIGNLKRGGIILIMIGTGSLQMISLPRGYTDGFTAWCKQVVALCFTLFMQNVLFTIGLMLTADTANIYLTIGILLTAAEVPRIAQMFGLDTSAKANIGGAVNTATHSISVAKTLFAAA